MSINYYKKYLKYKNKYLGLKVGGYYHCPDEAKRGEDHPVYFAETLDISFDDHTHKDRHIQNRCRVCTIRFADKKIGGCCHRICSACQIRIRRCPNCRNDITYIFKLNAEKTMWLRENVLVGLEYDHVSDDDDMIPADMTPVDELYEEFRISSTYNQNQINYTRTRLKYYGRPTFTISSQFD